MDAIKILRFIRDAANVNPPVAKSCKEEEQNPFILNAHMTRILFFWTSTLAYLVYLIDICIC